MAESRIKTIILADGAPPANAVFGPVICTHPCTLYIECVGTAGAAGTATIETSADGTTWFPLTNTLTIAGTTPDADKYNERSKYTRVSYVDTGAAGTITIKMNMVRI